MASYIVPRPRRAGSGNEAKLYHADSLRNVLYTSRVQTLVVRLRLQTYFTQEVVIRVDSKPTTVEVQMLTTYWELNENPWQIFSKGYISLEIILQLQ